MNFSIMNIVDVHGNLSVDYGKDGNKYYISLYDKEEKTSKSKEYETSGEALIVVKRFVDAFAYGLYSNNQRKSWLD